jgi:hypothetical protein
MDNLLKFLNGSIAVVPRNGRPTYYFFPMQVMLARRINTCKHVYGDLPPPALSRECQQSSRAASLWQHIAPAEQTETTPNLRFREERDLLAAGAGMKVSNGPNLTGHCPP